NDRTRGNRDVGNVEHGPADGTDTDIDEVDDTLLRAHAVDEVADSAATDERDGGQANAIGDERVPVHSEQRAERNDREHQDVDAGVLAEVDADRRTGIVDVREAHVIADDVRLLIQVEVFLYEQLGADVQQQDAEQHAREYDGLRAAPDTGPVLLDCTHLACTL